VAAGRRDVAAVMTWRGAVLAAAAIVAVLGGLHAEAARGADNALNIYNWADYIGKDAVLNFEKETGISVTYDTYDSDAALEAKVMTGDSGYDLVTTSTDFFGRQIAAQVYETLDRGKLPNWKNLDPRILAIVAKFDPGNSHAVPYLFGVNGFAYNIDMVHARMANAPVDSLDMIFKPEIVSKFADCGVSLVDNAEDVIQLALNYLHRDPNTHDPADFAAAEKLLLAIRPYIRTFDSAAYINALPNKEVCIAMSWSGDYQTAMARGRSAGVTLPLAFTVPKEGACAWYDAWLIPQGAPHPETAYRFLNYMLEPQVIAATTNDIHYGNSNLASLPFVDPKLKADPAIYPTAETMQRLYESQEVPLAVERLRTRLWTRVKTGE
jgi:putrescine transport system substrate-binding protein